MKKIGKFIKSNTKLLVGIILGAAVSGGVVYAATVLPSSQVGYDNSTSGLAATDVQGALDELYTRLSTWIAPMQGFDKSSLANVGDSVRLYDTRDGSTYVVRKLADGKIWMTENLRIANKTITPADSNVSSNFTIPASSNSDTDEFSQYNANNAYVDGIYGGYYTFYTATAGTGTSLTSGSAPSDICPKGWRLPGNSELSTLADNYNSSALMQGAPGFVLSGYAYRGNFTYKGSSGYYFSSAVVSGGYVYMLRIDGSTIYRSSQVANYEGLSVRCVAK